MGRPFIESARKVHGAIQNSRTKRVLDISFKEFMRLRLERAIHGGEVAGKHDANLFWQSVDKLIADAKDPKHFHEIFRDIQVVVEVLSKQVLTSLKEHAPAKKDCPVIQFTQERIEYQLQKMAA